jgi:hypothetical protein
MRAANDIAWLGGLCEGEAYFSYKRGSPSIKVSMTDADTVEKAATIFGCKAIGPQPPRSHKHKPVWTATVHGYTAVGWMMTLYSFLGQRRRSVVVQAIAQWNRAPGFARKVRGIDGVVLKAVCHPERDLHARQLCRQCYGKTYMKAWRADRKRSGVRVVYFGPCRPATCHPDRPLRSNGLCEGCYLKQWRAKRHAA